MDYFVFDGGGGVGHGGAPPASAVFDELAHLGVNPLWIFRFGGAGVGGGVGESGRRSSDAE